MVDFNKHVYNSIKFSPAAEFYKKNKCYTLAPRGTTDYNTYWEQETSRCLNGYTAPDGDSITGYHYFYLNYSPIMKLKEVQYKDREGNLRTRRERVLDFPRFWDYDYYYFNAIEQAEDEGKHMSVLKSRQRGYEQPYSELIGTPDGFVEMGSLQIGDYVLNPDGGKTKIIDIFEQGYKDVYEVTLADGRSVKCGANHLWEIICANNKFKHKVMKTHDIMCSGLYNNCTVNGKRYNCYKYYLPSIEPIQYEEKSVNIHPYVLGALLGDGAITAKTPRFSSIDQPIIDRILQLLGSGFEFKYDSTTTCEYRIIDKERFLHKSEFKNGKYGVNRLNRWLQDLGLKVSCEYKFIPDIYKYGSVEQRMELIRGLMDTDGYISKDGSIYFTNTSKQLINDVVDVLRSLGILCSVSKADPADGGICNGRAIFGRKFSYRVYIKGNPDVFYLPRKRERIKKNRKFSNKVAIVDIKYLAYQEQQRCIMVDNPNHLYITRDYIPTHNSFKGASMLVRNYELIPGSKNFAVASEQKFLIGDGLLTKAWQIMDFIDKNTAWAKQRLVSTRMERVAGYKVTDEFGKQTEQGYMSSITGITLKNDPERIRGTRGKLVLWEEGGKFPSLLDAWRIEQPSVETDDGVAFGLMVAFGTGGTEGCLTAGNKVYTSTGEYKNIECVNMRDGIVGYDINDQKTYVNTISHINKPIQKQCVTITTNQYRDISCSIDHPIYASNHYDYNECRVWEWLDASVLKIGDLVAVAQDIPVFGNKSIFDPYLIGLLIGDGTYGGTSPYLFNADEEIINYVVQNYDCVDSRKPYVTKDGRLFRSLRIHGIIRHLKKLGIQGQTKLKKQLPVDIFSSDKKSCCELLAGLFDTDGCVRIGKIYGNRLPATNALFTTVSLDLAKQVRDLLQKIGVYSAIQVKKQRNRSRKIKDKYPYYNVEISDKVSLINLYENVHLKVKHKQQALIAIAEICKNKKRWYKNDFYYEKIKSVENIGNRTVYNLTADDTHTYISNGIITHNSSFTGLKELFYKPEAYNVLSFSNIWDDNAEQTRCGFFVPSWSNLESFDKNGNYVYMDQDGNSLKEKAIENLITQRNKIKDGGASQQSIDRFISERPIKPREAVLELGKNIFPRKLLLDQLTRIRTNPKLRSMKHIVDLNWDGNGQIIATEKKSGDITEYPLKKGDKPTGSIVIWEYPIKDPPFGLYIGGCLTPGEKVITQRGLVNVEDITLNDKLLNRENKFVEIKNLQRYNKVNEDIFEIKPYGSFRTTKFTGEHPIWINKRGFVKAKEVSKEQWLEIPNRFITNKMDILDDTTLKLYYFYGLWVGDGFCTKNGNSYDIYMSIGKDEKELAEFYDKIIYELFNRKCIHIRKQTEQSRRFTNKDLFLKLKSMFGNSAYDKRIPDEIKQLPYNYKRAFLQGYLDSDGSVFNTKRGVRTNFTSVNLQLLEDIQDMLFGMQIANSIVIHQKECTNEQGIHSLQSYRINISKSDQKKLYYNAVFNSRKMQLLKNTFGYTKSKMPIKFIGDKILIKIENVKQSSYTGVVYNFECDTHTFMCRNILTHNCDPLNISGV